MAVWTIAAQEGTGGEALAVELAAQADARLLDRHELALIAHELDPAFPLDHQLEARLGGRLSAFALSTAISTGSIEAANELQLRRTLPAIGRAVLAEASRTPCVIYAPAAFAALMDHPGAVHARLLAPLECRIATCQREDLLDRRRAAKFVKHADHRTQAWVRTLYGVDIDDARHFSVVLDVSRFPSQRLVEILLTAAGVHPSSEGAMQSAANLSSTTTAER
jgi:hypothetical protein